MSLKYVMKSCFITYKCTRHIILYKWAQSYRGDNLKKVGALFLMVFMAIIGLPTFITSFLGDQQVSYQEGVEKKVENENKDNIRMIKVLDAQSGDIMDLEFEEYIKGVLAAEMPALFEIEALKAQAVAARTYAIKKINQKGSEDLKGADISTDPSKGQAYLSKEELKKIWGDNFYTYYDKISKAVEETRNEIMTYEEEPIEAVFHSTSAGITQSAKDVWEVDVPYLQSVESIGDEEAPAFESETKLSKQEVYQLLKEKYSDIVIQDLMQQIQIIERSSGGYIKKVQIGNKVLSGEEMRKLFNLRSSCFSIEEDGDYLIFTTKGYGHGAGMSQYGANFMAKEGKNYREILSHYYQGVQIKEINEIGENILKNE